jgi:hypothetical protein
VQPFPMSWSDADILRRLRDAELRCQRGQPAVTALILPACKSVGQLLRAP